VEQRIVIKFLVGENVPSAEIHHRLQQQYGEECQSRSYLNHLVYERKLRTPFLSINCSIRVPFDGIPPYLLTVNLTTVI